jgi:hypothetical protein
MGTFRLLLYIVQSRRFKKGMDELMGFGWERLGKYALCPPESQGKKWLMGGAARATITGCPTDSQFRRYRVAFEPGYFLNC